jgi:secondary thiamine-phosphate synthase enzyme
VRTDRFTVDTRGRFVVDVTDPVLDFAHGTGGDGLLHVFLSHATAGLALMETGAGSEVDLREAVERLLPRDDRYAHRHGSPGHGADHLLPAFMSPSLVLAVHEGEVVLGTWQRIVVLDPNRENNERTVVLSFVQAVT